MQNKDANSRKVKRYIYRAWRMHNGKKLWAKNYGLKAWAIPIYE